MIKEECKVASRILHRVFAGDIMTVATIVTAEANNDYETLRKMLLRVQDEIGRLVVALKKLEIKGFLKHLETITGGKGEWRQMCFKHCGGWWFKYVRMYRIKGDYFVVCDQDNVPVMWELMKEENLKDGEYLNHAHGWK